MRPWARATVVIAAWLGGVATVIVVAADAVWPDGYTVVTSFVAPDYPRVQTLVILFWLYAAVAWWAALLALGSPRSPLSSMGRVAVVALGLCGLLASGYAVWLFAHVGNVIEGGAWRAGGNAGQLHEAARHWLTFTLPVPWLGLVANVAVLAAAMSRAARGPATSWAADGVVATRSTRLGGGSDALASRLAPWTALGALGVVLTAAIRGEFWNSGQTALVADKLGVSDTVAAGLVLLVLAGWTILPLIAAVRFAAAPRLAWALAAAAGAYGVLGGATAAVADARSWQTIGVAHTSGWLSVVPRALDAARESTATALVTDATILVLAVLLLFAAARQYAAWRRSRVAETSWWRGVGLAYCSITVVAVAIAVAVPYSVDALAESGVAVGGGGGSSATASSSPSPTVSPTVVAHPATPAGRTPGIIGVVPAVSSDGPWSGDSVVVTLRRAGTHIDVTGCSIKVDGEQPIGVGTRLSERAAGGAVVEFRWVHPFEFGQHDFSVIVTALNGGWIECRWSARGGPRPSPTPTGTAVSADVSVTGAEAAGLTVNPTVPEPGAKAPWDGTSVVVELTAAQGKPAIDTKVCQLYIDGEVRDDAQVTLQELKAGKAALIFQLPEALKAGTYQIKTAILTKSGNKVDVAWRSISTGPKP